MPALLQEEFPPSFPFFMGTRHFAAAGVRSLLDIKPRPSISIKSQSSSSTNQPQGRSMSYGPPDSRSGRSSAGRWWDEENEKPKRAQTKPFNAPYAQNPPNRTSRAGENLFDVLRGVPAGPQADRNLTSSSNQPQNESPWSSSRAFEDNNKISPFSRNNFEYAYGAQRGNGRETSHRSGHRDDGRMNAREPPRFPRSMLNNDSREAHRSSKPGVSSRKSKHNSEFTINSRSHLLSSQEVPEPEDDGPPVFDSPFNFASVPSKAFKSVPGAPADKDTPSDEYFTQATVPSHALPESEAPRKLLILDLNGTLVVRSGKNQIYPRPYMPSFRDYIFDKRTQKWLDTMVWSSAASKNVERMVYRCFLNEDLLGEVKGEPIDKVLKDKGKGRGKDISRPENWGYWRGKLLDVWARDKLGLTEEEYYTKSATTKNLNSIWYSLNKYAKNVDTDSKQAQQSSTISPHGPETTFLLDDSPYKVRLQPYNHICLLEYDMDLREHDLGVLDTEQRKNGTAYDDRYHPSAFGHQQPRSSIYTSLPTLWNWQSNREDPTGRQRNFFSDLPVWRPAAPTGPALTRRAQPQPQPQKTESRFSSFTKSGYGTYRHQSPGFEFHVEDEVPESSDSSDETAAPSSLNTTFDETLLAVIGVVESLRPQSNVAGWIKEGGLWADRKAPTVSINALRAAEASGGEDGRRSPTDFEVEELSKERKYKEDVMTTNAGEELKEVVLPGNDAFALPLAFDSKSASSPIAPTFNLSSLPPSSFLKDAMTGHKVTHHSHAAHPPHTNTDKYVIHAGSMTTASNATIEVLSSSKDKRPHSLRPKQKINKTYGADSIVHAKPTVPMWFDDEETFRTWVARGREVLKNMEIPERHGVL